MQDHLPGGDRSLERMSETASPQPQEDKQMNAASQWRLALARRVAAHYSDNPKVAAVIVGGSVSRGHADRYSDIEIGAFWHQPPIDAERLAAATAAAQAAGGYVHRLYPYDEQE